MDRYKDISFKQFIVHIFMNDTGVSSKRVAGILGWLVCIFICIYCTVLGFAAPVIIETLFYCTAALLGLDTITSIWKHREYEKPSEVSDTKEERKK